MSDLMDKVKKALDSGKDTAEDFGEKVKKSASDLNEKIGEGVEDLKDKKD